MKITSFLTLATLASQTLAAVPHRRDHKHLHLAARDNQQGTVTVTKTVIEPSAVVWVDNTGKTVSTEYRGSPPTSPANTNNNVAPPAAPQAAPAQNNNQANTAANTQSSAAAGNGGYGICYDMINGQSQCKSADVVDKEFAFLASQGFKMIRTYDIGCNVGVLAQKAAAHGLKIFAGINGVGNVAGDLAKLIGFINGNWAAIDTINIGNEQVNHGIASSVVAAAVNQGRGILRAAGFQGSVVASEVFNSYDATLIAASDYVAANAHGFFDTSNSAEKNGAWGQKTYDALVAKAGGKKVVISESGWPHGGNSNGGAIAGKPQQDAAIAALKSAFANKQDSLYLFQAYDATYKQPGPMGIERSFGIYGSD